MPEHERQENQRSATTTQPENQRSDEAARGPEDQRSDEADQTDQDQVEEEDQVENQRITKTGQGQRQTRRYDYKQANSKGFNFLNFTDPTKIDRVKMAKHIMGIVLTQLDPEDQQKKTYYWKKGIKVMGNDTIKAMVVEKTTSTLTLLSMLNLLATSGVVFTLNLAQ